MNGWQTLRLENNLMAAYPDLPILTMNVSILDTIGTSPL